MLVVELINTSVCDCLSVHIHIVLVDAETQQKQTKQINTDSQTVVREMLQVLSFLWH